MKNVKDVVACVIDYGTFLCIAEKLAETFRCVYYHSPFETEYQDVRDCVIGTGLDRVIRCDNPLDPDILDSIDLFVFPDIGFTGLQAHLRSMGKAVWGHSGATELELDRPLFLRTVASVGLPTPNYKVITGLGALKNHLRDVENKWIKTSRYRGNIETFKFRSMEQDEGTLNSLAVIFGGAKETVTFVVQDEIDSETEIGYDGDCVDGVYPSSSFQGFEKKNELYLGSVKAYHDLPEAVWKVNEAFAPVLAAYQYRCAWATEIRVTKDGTPYFIDPTARMPGQTGEHQVETISNFAERIWYAANGKMIEPEFNYEYAAEATLHYDCDTKDPTIVDEWKVLSIPDSIARWVKLYRYAKIGGRYHFPGRNTDEVGVVIGVGPNNEGAIKHLQKNLERLEKLPVHADVSGFDELKKAMAKVS